MVPNDLLVTWPLRFDSRLGKVPEKHKRMSLVIEDEGII